MDEEIDRWEKENGVKFLHRMGLREGQKVLDFGCGYGHYSLPAAELVGDEGIVFAVDKKEEPLSSVSKKASDRSLSNIKTIKNSDSVSLKLDDRSIDAVLLFDILHYMEGERRNELYREAHRVLKSGGSLIVHPKHTKDDFPMGEFKDMDNQDVVDEIEEAGFTFDFKFCGDVAHDEGITEGCVFNFQKNEDGERS